MDVYIPTTDIEQASHVELHRSFDGVTLAGTKVPVEAGIYEVVAGGSCPGNRPGQCLVILKDEEHVYVPVKNIWESGDHTLIHHDSNLTV